MNKKMSVSEILQDVYVEPLEGADAGLEVGAVEFSSRGVEPGALFFCVPGTAADGHDYAADAVQRGAAALVVERPLALDVPQFLVYDARKALALGSARFYGQPSEKLRLVGVTGTNGKTTTTFLVEHMAAVAGEKTGLMGTVECHVGAEVRPSLHTTPESRDLQMLLADMASAGVGVAALEVSSHAIDLGRILGTRFAVAAFTNLTQDHLDFHKTMEAYCDAKAILFRNCDTGVVNADDPWTGRLMENASCKVLTYSEKAESDLRAENVSLGADHIAFTAVTKEKKVPIRVNIPGGFMVYNTLDVLGAALALGVSLEKSAEVLAGVPHVKGRVEVVPTPGKDYTILIDYAHSPDGLENVLSSVKGFAKGRTIALFGCGGDRDKTKRPKMGKVAADLADFAIVTTDNPRTEVPADIIRDILPGFESSDTPYIVVEDRIQAIHWAMDHAEKGDVIVLCGKGHETYQEINHVKHHMDEREIVADYLNAGK